MKNLILFLISVNFFNYLYSQSIDNKGRKYFENKNVGSAKNIISGKNYILSIFASKGEKKWTQEEKQHFINKQKIALDWISKEALKYDRKVNFKQGIYYYDSIDFKLNSELLVKSTESIRSVSGSVNIEVLKALQSQGFSSTNDFMQYIKNKYNCTNVLVHLFVKGKGKSFANTFFSTSSQKKYLEVTLIAEKNKWDVETYNSSIAHETLHLFGGWDLYAVVSNDIKREKLAKEKFPNSIFLKTNENINQHKIDEITAWRIGLIGRREWYLNFIPKHYFW